MVLLKKKRSLVRPLKKVTKAAKVRDAPVAEHEDGYQAADLGHEDAPDPKSTGETADAAATPADVPEQKKAKLRRGPVLLKGEPSPLYPLASVTRGQLDEEDDGQKKGKKANLLSLRELAASIQKSGADAVKPVVKELTKLAKKKSLNVPLLKPDADRVSRAANYEDVSNTTTKKWGDVVRMHQTADHLSFPLPVTRSLDDETPVPVPRINLKSDMETKIDALLSASDNRLQDSSVLTPAEEKLMQTLSVEEAKERLKELQRTRALLSYQEAKLKRQAKIKSKSFHRVRKRETLRTALKDFESLKETDPAAALQQLQDFDRTRALERASLRHRNTGRFAKQAKIRAKYDDTARAALEEQMHIHQQHVKRRELSSDEEQEAGGDDDNDDEEEDGVPDSGNGDDGDKQMDGNKEVVTRDPSTDPAHPDDDDEGAFDVADSYNPWLKSAARDSLQNEAEKEGVAGGESSARSADRKEVPQIRLRKSFLRNPADDVIHADPADDDDDDDNEAGDGALVLRKRNQLEVISEAFAEDDVVQEFLKETQEKEKLDQEEETELPGWGSWAGVGSDWLNTSEARNRKRKRREELKGTMSKKKVTTVGGNSHDPKVIVNPDTGASGHRVKQVPFPFRSVPEFEAGILAGPIGRTFVPETAFRVLTREKVSTMLGTMIPPMAEENVRLRKTRDATRGRDRRGKSKNKNKQEKEEEEGQELD